MFLDASDLIGQYHARRGREVVLKFSEIQFGQVRTLLRLRSAGDVMAQRFISFRCDCVESPGRFGATGTDFGNCDSSLA